MIVVFSLAVALTIRLHEECFSFATDAVLYMGMEERERVVSYVCLSQPIIQSLPISTKC